MKLKNAQLKTETLLFQGRWVNRTIAQKLWTLIKRGYWAKAQYMPGLLDDMKKYD